MGFLWEDSTGARAVRWLREKEQGFVVDTITFAQALEVKPGALHQLLANAVKLRYIKKVYGRGPCVGWKLGAAGDSVTIERRKSSAPASAEELARRRAASARRRQRADQPHQAEPAARPVISWPPGFVSAFSPADSYRPPRLVIDEPDPAELEAAALPVWLRGLIVTPAPPIVEEPPEPAPEQLQLFDPAEVGPGGRARWRSIDLEIPVAQRIQRAQRWRQTTFLEL